MTEKMPSSLEIAQRATLRPIVDVAADAGIEPDELEQYGRYKAKVDLSLLDRLAGGRRSRSPRGSGRSAMRRSSVCARPRSGRCSA